MLIRRGDYADKIISAFRRFQHWSRSLIGRWTQQVSPDSQEVAAVIEQNCIALLRRGDAHRRWDAAAELGRSSQRSPEAIDALIEALADPEPFVRWQAAQALGAQEAERVFVALCGVFASDHPLSRASAAEALGHLGGEAAWVVLQGVLADPDAAVRAAAAQALSKCTDPAAASALLPLLEDPSDDVRRAAASALGRMGDVEAASALAGALIRPDQPLLVRRSLAAALARVPNPDTQSVLLASLYDPDPQVRAYLAHALGRVGDESARPALVTLQEDENRLLRGTVGDAARQAMALLEKRARHAQPAHQSGASG